MRSAQLPMGIKAPHLRQRSQGSRLLRKRSVLPRSARTAPERTSRTAFVRSSCERSLREVLELARGDQLELTKNLGSELTDLSICVDGVSLEQRVAPSSHVAGDDDSGLRHVRHDRAGCLTSLLALQALFHQSLDQCFVGLGCVVHRRIKFVFNQVVFVSKRRGNDRLRVLDVDESLTQLRVRQVPVPNQLMGQRPADSGHIDRRRSMLQDREVPLLEDVREVVVVRLSLRVRLVEALVARTPGELCQQVSVGADPVISNSGSVLTNLLHVRNKRVSNQIDLQLSSPQYRSEERRVGK